jgi:hypothetical protein
LEQAIEAIRAAGITHITHFEQHQPRLVAL